MAFSRAQAEHGLLQVKHAARSWGTGFLVCERFIFTACHCLPRLPDPILAGDDLVLVSLRRSTEGQEIAKAVVVYADPVADIAILGCPDDQLLAEESVRFIRMLGSVESLPVQLKALRPLSKMQVHVRSVTGDWFSGEALITGMKGQTLVVTLHNKEARIPAGTSGSPVLDDRGHVVGILKIGLPSSSGYLALALPDNLPVWMLDLVKN